MLWLVALDGALEGHRFLLTEHCLIGRGMHNHVVLDDTRISRQHARISAEAGQYVLINLNSANGTFVNDVLVQRHVLQPDDIVRFGSTSFRFESEVDGPRSVRRRAPPLREAATQTDLNPVKVSDLRAPSSESQSPLGAGLYELEDADRKLRTLYVFMQAISSTFDTRELLDRVVRNLFDIFPTAWTVAIYLRSPGSKKLSLRMARGRDEGPMVGSGAPALFITADEKKPLPGTKSKVLPPQSRMIDRGAQMHAPMLYHDSVLGVIQVVGEDKSQFLRDDLALLTGLSAQVAMALQNVLMHQESLKQERLKQDLKLAEQIQKSFLPRQLPQVEGIALITEYRPAYSVGGDFYDVFRVSENRIGIFIGDVSGKGISAALLMARISSDLRVAALAEVEPARVLARVNQEVLKREQTDIFVTAIYLTLDVRIGKMILANAGHPPPFIRRSSGAVERIDGGTGPAIGVFEDALYEHAQVEVAPGDTIVLCTDGVTESTSVKGKQFGFESLTAILASGSSDAADLVARLLEDIQVHVGEAAQYDDLTLVVCGMVGREGEPGPGWNEDDTPVSS